MSYVHGLGDAQERFAMEYDIKYGWIADLKIICPRCGSSEFVDVEDFEKTDSDETGEEWTLDCWCQTCAMQFEHIHEFDFS